LALRVKGPALDPIRNLDRGSLLAAAKAEAIGEIRKVPKLPKKRAAMEVQSD
jgi:hypothetical protein